MKITATQLDSLKAHLREMTAGDRSITEALPQTLQEEEMVRLVTMPGSRNDQLWSEMASLGWMKLDQPLEEHPASQVYIVSREAREPLETLLLDLKRDALVRLFNDLRRDIPPLIAPPVIEAGGTPSDVIMMLAGVVEATMRRWINDDLHEEFLQAVLDRARDLARDIP